MSFPNLQSALCRDLPISPGVTTRLLPVISDEPKFVTVAAQATWQGLQGSGVATSVQLKAATKRAVGEAIERLAWGRPPGPRLSQADDEESVRLDLSRLFTYSSTRNMSPSHWVLGYHLATQAQVLVPTELVFKVNYENLVRCPNTTGLAAACSVEEAVLTGLLEVMERSAFMRSWVRSSWGLRKPHSLNRELVELLARYRLEPLVFELPPIVASVTTCLVLLTDRTSVGPEITCGLAARFSLEECLVHAIEEALQIRLWIRRATALNPGAGQRRDLNLKRAIYWGSDGRGLCLAASLCANSRLSTCDKNSMPPRSLPAVIGQLVNLGLTPLGVPLGHYLVDGCPLYVVRAIVPELEFMFHDAKEGPVGRPSEIPFFV